MGGGRVREEGELGDMGLGRGGREGGMAAVEWLKAGM